MSDADINAEIGVGVISAPMAGGPFVATPGEPMSDAEPRAKDEAWSEKREKPE
jgi:NADH-quinone oxidoreductase subunit C